MKPLITVITIGVEDLDVSLRFYRDGLGFPTEGIVGKEFEHGAVVFINLQPGLRLALWPRSSIAHDTGLAAGVANSQGHPWLPTFAKARDPVRKPGFCLIAFEG